MKKEMSKSMSKGASMGKQSSVIKPGTGSGSRPNSSKVAVMDSAPKDKHGLGRKPPGALK